MKWERCIRCGSNRVRQRFFILRGSIIIFIAFLIGAISTGVSGMSAGTSDMSTGSGPFSIVGDIVGILDMLLIYYGIFVIFKSKKLYCKDCEMSWKPTKD